MKGNDFREIENANRLFASGASQAPPKSGATETLGVEEALFKQAKSKQPKHHGEGHRGRLRDRFLVTGFQGFAEHEKVELLLTLAIPRRDVKGTAKLLLAKFGTIRAILDARPEELQKIPGMGSVASVALKIIKETASLYLQDIAEERPQFNDADSLIDFWRTRIGGLKNEVFEVAYLDTQLYLIRDGVQRLEEGIVDRANVYPRKVMDYALRREAASIIVAHNHPSGLLEASDADIRLTQALVRAGKAVGVNVVDHIIITEDDGLSFCREGML